MLPPSARNQSSAVPVISMPSMASSAIAALTAATPPAASRQMSVAVLSLTTTIIQAASRSGIGAGVAGDVGPDRRDGDAARVRHRLNLDLVVSDREVEIGRARHDHRLGGDRGERRAEVAGIELVGAEIGMLPGPQHAEEVVG